jgi:hypothetical protein
LNREDELRKESKKKEQPTPAPAAKSLRESTEYAKGNSSTELLKTAAVSSPESNSKQSPPQSYAVSFMQFALLVLAPPLLQHQPSSRKSLCYLFAYTETSDPSKEADLSEMEMLKRQLDSLQQQVEVRLQLYLFSDGFQLDFSAHAEPQTPLQVLLSH